MDDRSHTRRLDISHTRVPSTSICHMDKENTMSGECDKCSEHALDCECGNGQRKRKNKLQVLKELGLLGGINVPGCLSPTPQRKSMSEWISVSSLLPPHGQLVLCHDTQKCYIAFRPVEDEYNEHWTICDQCCSCPGCTGAITHWMPLPPPPITLPAPASKHH